MEPSLSSSARFPLPSVYYVGPFLLIGLTAALRKNLPSVGFRLAVVIGLTAILLHALQFDTGDGHQNYATGSTFGSIFFTAIAMLLLSDPIKEYRHESQEEPTTEMPLWKRFYWAMCVQFSPRGVGWSHQIAQLTPIPRQTRLQFLSTRILRIAWYALLADMADTYLDLNPLFALSGAQARSFRSQGPVMTLCNVLGYLTTAYAVMNMAYDTASFVIVAIGLSEPKYWPVSFGRWMDAYTVRRFWGRTWHQQMRRFVSLIGKFAARLLGFAPGTWLSSRTQLIIGFSVSGLAHVVGDAMIDPYWTGSSYWFFLYNALAIIFEDFVISVGKRLGVKEGRATRLLGYVWTLVWFTYSTPLYADWAMVAGLGSHRVFPRSLVVKPTLSYFAHMTGVDVLAWVAQKCAI